MKLANSRSRTNPSQDSSSSCGQLYTTSGDTVTSAGYRHTHKTSIRASLTKWYPVRLNSHRRRPCRTGIRLYLLKKAPHIPEGPENPKQAPRNIFSTKTRTAASVIPWRKSRHSIPSNTAVERCRYSLRPVSVPLKQPSCTPYGRGTCPLPPGLPKTSMTAKTYKKKKDICLIRVKNV